MQKSTIMLKHCKKKNVTLVSKMQGSVVARGRERGTVKIRVSWKRKRGKKRKS